MSHNISKGASEWGLLDSEFGQLSQWLLPAGVAPRPARLVEAAQLASPVVDAVGLTVISSTGEPRTAAASAIMARRADHLQYLARQGPCLDAAAGDDLVRADDLTVDHRWPTFSAAVVRELDVHSVLSVPLRLDSSVRAALNFYAAAPGVLTEREAAVASLFASFVALALDAEQARAEVEQLQTALSTSRHIGAAIGIVMAHGLLTPEQAFAKLRDVSQRLNRKVRDVAIDVIESGELPTVATPVIPRPAGRPKPQPPRTRPTAVAHRG